jgi:tropomyosin
LEADAAVERAEAAEAKNKKLELELLAREQEVTSLNHRLNVVEGNLEKAETTLADAKHASQEGDTAKSTAESLQRKIQILEEELDTAEKNLKETVEKFVFHLHFDFVSYFQPNLMGC